MNGKTQIKLTNWQSELYYSTPKSFQVGGPRSKMPIPNSTPFNPKKAEDQ